MKVKDSKLNPNNPQKFDDLSKLENSIKEFPKMMSLRPIVINNNNMVLGGNKRLICLKNLGYKEIPDNWVKQADELTDEEIKRFIIADNVGFGEWDLELLQDWDSQDLEDWGLNLDFDTDIIDIDEVDEFTESVNFTIKCENLEELNILQDKLKVNSSKLSFSKFIELI